MKKFFMAILMVMLVAAPAMADLFTNGGFEDGNFNGWQLQYGNVINDTYNPVWGVNPIYYGYDYGTVTPQIVTSSTTHPGQTLIDINPYNGNYMAKINDVVGYWHATRLSQTGTIAAADLTKTLYVNWGAVLENPNHSSYDQPVFSIKVLKNGVVVNSFFADATQAAATWTHAGFYNDDLYYKSGQYTYDLDTGGFIVGDQITIDMFVTDCGQGGHGGYAFLDGIGTEYVPPPDTAVPEPSTWLLLGTGLAGLVAYKRKKRA